MTSSLRFRHFAFCARILAPAVVAAGAAAGCGAELNVGPRDPDPGVEAEAGAPAPSAIPREGGAPASKSFAEEARELGTHWTWLDVPNPRETMMTVAGSSLSDIFYAGTHGTVRHWDGRNWVPQIIEPKVSFTLAWSPGPSSVWLVGSEADGRSRFFRVNSGVATEDTSMAGITLQALSGVGPNLAWALGVRGEVRAWNGATWSVTRAAQASWLRGIHGFSSSDVWAVGDVGQIIHYDGASWSTPSWGGAGANPLDADYMYSGVWGAAPNDVWAIGTRRTRTTFADGSYQNLPVFSHFDGATWSVALLPSDVCGDETPYGSSTGGQWWEYAPGANADNVAPLGATIAGVSATRVLASETQSCAWSYDGQSWRAEPALWFDSQGTRHGFRGGSQPRITRLSNDALLAFDMRWDPSASKVPVVGPSPRWKTMLPNQHGGGGSSLAVDATGNLWAADAYVKLWTPAGWSQVALPEGPVNALVWGAGDNRHLVARSATDVWVGHFGFLAPWDGVGRWDGTAWHPVPLGRTTALAANAAHVWALSQADSPNRVGHPGLRIHRLNAAGDVEASLDPEALGTWRPASGIEPAFALLPENETSDRVLFAFSRWQNDDGNVDCVIGSWGGAEAPKLIAVVPSCLPTTDWSARVERLTRLSDGSLALVTEAGVWTWNAAGVARKVTCVANMCRTDVTSVTITRADGNASQLNDLAPAPGGRMWLAAGGAILLWDPKTGDLAEVLENSDIRTFAPGLRGEVFGASYPSNSYGSPGSDTIHFVPPDITH